MRQWRPFIIATVFIFSIALLCSAATLISVRNAEPYKGTQSIPAYPEDYQTAEQIATTVATAWDSGAGLVRAGGRVNCAAQGQFTNGLLFEFGASKPFFGFSRVSFARVTIEPTTNLVTIVAEPTDTFGHPATMNANLVDLDLDDAIEIAEKNGGAHFLQEHPNCTIGFSHYDYIWRLRYAVDLRDYRSDNLRFEIDSQTGELLSATER